MFDKKLKSYKSEVFDLIQRIFIEKKFSNSTMRFIIKLKGKVDIENFKKTVQLIIDIFPLVSCKYEESFFSYKWSYQNHSLDDFVYIVEGKEGEEEDDLIMKYFYKTVDYDNGLHIKFVVIQYQDHDSIVISINHMLCDATAFKNLLYIFCDLYANPEHVENYSLMGDRGLSQLFKNFSLKENYQIMTSPGYPPHENVKFDLEGDPNRPFLEVRTLTREDFDKLKSYSKEKSSTLNDIFLTALMRTFYKIFKKTVVITCDINLRKFLKDGDTEGFTNMLTTLDCNIGEEIGETFEETLSKIVKCMNKEKNNIFCTKGLLQSELVMKLLPYRYVKQIIGNDLTPSPLEITNLGIIDKSKVYFKDVEASSVLLTGSTKYAPSFELSVCTFDKMISFCINLYGTESDQKIIKDALDLFIEELTSVY